MAILADENASRAYFILAQWCETTGSPSIDPPPSSYAGCYDPVYTLVFFWVCFPTFHLVTTRETDWKCNFISLSLSLSIYLSSIFVLSVKSFDGSQHSLVFLLTRFKSVCQKSEFPKWWLIWQFLNLKIFFLLYWVYMYVSDYIVT